MIRYLHHKEIDKIRWDQCIHRSVNGLVYALSWYLDLVSPGWEALAEEDYSTVFPLTHRRKYGIRYLYQPFFTQQLGIFSSVLLTPELTEKYLRSIPSRFRFAEIHLNSLNKIDPDKFRVIPRLNHELDLSAPYASIQRRYSQNTRRNIRKALDAGLSIRKKITPDDLTGLFRANYAQKEGKLKYRDYMTVSAIMRRASEKAAGILLAAGSREDRLDAAAFFLKDRNRWIMLLAASDYRTRDNGAMFFLVDSFIREQAGIPLLLDFEGGNDPSLGRFYKSFGAAEKNYPFVHISRLPVFVEKFISWKKSR